MLSSDSSVMWYTDTVKPLICSDSRRATTLFYHHNYIDLPCLPTTKEEFTQQQEPCGPPWYTRRAPARNVSGMNEVVSSSMKYMKHW